MSLCECDLCNAQATHFFTLAHLVSGVRAPADEESAEVALCDHHADVFAVEQSRRMVEQLGTSLSVASRLAEMPACVMLSYAARDGDSTEALREILRQKCDPNVYEADPQELHAFNISFRLPIRSDVGMTEWLLWLATTTSVRGCKLTLWHWGTEYSFFAEVARQG